MPKFTARIVLHEATWEDYTNLATEMANAGFVDAISSSTATYELPDAEYNGDATDLQAALAIAEAAAKACGFSVAPDTGWKSGRKYGVLVTHSAGRRWVGLKKM